MGLNGAASNGDLKAASTPSALITPTCESESQKTLGEARSIRVVPHTHTLNLRSIWSVKLNLFLNVRPNTTLPIAYHAGLTYFKLLLVRGQ